MGSVVGEMRAEFRRDKHFIDRKLKFFAINPGKLKTEWGSQNIKGPPQLKEFVDKINSEKAFVALVQDPFSVFIAKQVIDRLTIWLRAASASSSNAAALLVERAADLTVEEGTIVNDSLLKTITSTLKHQIDGVEAGKARFVVVTLNEELKQVDD